MKFSSFTILVFAGLLALVAGWTTEDYEIFQLRDELELSEGPNFTFYDFVGVKSSASQEEIGRAFKKKGRQFHPDKVKQSFIASRAKPTAKPKGQKPGVHVAKPPSEREVSKAVKDAEEKFRRLSLIVTILRGEGRARYDHFLENGFPKWRGTGYYYARFRPGLLSTLFGLFIFGGGLVHYVTLYLSWKRQRDFVEKYIRDARRTAWGNDSGIAGIPGLETLGGAASTTATAGQEDEMVAMNRRQKRLQERESRKGKDQKRSRSAARRGGTSTPQEGESPAPQGQKRRVQAENGKILLVDSTGQVFLEEEDEDGKKEEFLLDPAEIKKPTFRNTVVYRLPIWAYRTISDRLTGKSRKDHEAEDSESSDTDNEKKSSPKADPLTNGTTRRAVRRTGRARK